MTPTPPVARVRWLCRRGMQELDRLVGPFVDAHYEALPEVEKRAVVRLLETEDDRLWDWFLGRSQPDDQELAGLVERIRSGG